MSLVPGRPVVLRGPRVELSTPAEPDIDRVAELCRDPAIAEWTTVPSPYERSDAESFICEMVADGWASGRGCTWAIREDGQVLGLIGLDGIADHAAEIGFWLAPEARGRGLMTEATGLVLDFAFAEAPDGVGLQRVEWHAFGGNIASAAVARRAGFRFEGVSRLGAVQRGIRRDDWQAGLLRDDPRAAADGWPAETFGA